MHASEENVCIQGGHKIYSGESDTKNRLVTEINLYQYFTINQKLCIKVKTSNQEFIYGIICGLRSKYMTDIKQSVCNTSLCVPHIMSIIDH